MEIICAHCGNKSDKKAAYVHRANKIGAPQYCDKTCAGLGRRSNKTIEEKKAEKAAYDKALRQQPWYKAYKNSNWKKNYDPVKAAEYRQKRMAYHVEYCRKPEYKAKKVDYDKHHRAVKNYGEFAEAFLITEQIFSLIDNRVVKENNQLTNKSIKRKRQWLKRKKTNLVQ